MMKYLEKVYPAWKVKVQESLFKTGNGVTEGHLMLHVDPDVQDFSIQLQNLHSALQELLSEKEKNEMKPVFIRYFLSDVSNQAASIPEYDHVAVSWVQQPPLDGSKVGIWVWIQEKVEIKKDISFIVSHNGYNQLWWVQNQNALPDSEQQTVALLEEYSNVLKRQECELERDCVRTWFFVRDIDVNYAGMVKGRNEVFTKNGLTPQSHFIASTGIAGSCEQLKAFVLMDAYAVKGLQEGQLKFLYALTHLNPTYEYGVAFERGTLIEYGDRKHAFISGTASIDHEGKILYEGDVIRQAGRVIENIEKLLEEAGMKLENLAHLIVYLRDISDRSVIENYLSEHFSLVPRVMVWAPVCRPGWLIEMEGMAVAENNNAYYKKF